MARIAIGGWQHETNTFAPVKADFVAFEEAGGWPGLSRGQELFDAVEGVHLPITGAMEALDRHGHELLPLLWCAATPSAHVTEDAFERICEMFLSDLEKALPVDGVYLDLHGAMVCEHFEDGEGEFLKRLRALLGDDVPVVVSLDLHANVTEAMVRNASVLDIFRAYPHVDMGETGARTAAHLHRLLETGERWASAFRRTDFVIPLNWGCTLVDPAKSLYECKCPHLIADPVTAVSLALRVSPRRHLRDGASHRHLRPRSEGGRQGRRHAFGTRQRSRRPAFAGRIWDSERGRGRSYRTGRPSRRAGSARRYSG